MIQYIINDNSSGKERAMISASSGRIPRDRTRFAYTFAVVFVLVGSALYAGGAAEKPTSAKAPGLLRVVAAENFYGDIATQLAGPYATVTSVLSDPNVDPHEYESSVNDAKSIAAANLVIENGGGYDDWMDKLLSASPSVGRLTIKGYDLASVKLPDNEHVWYSVDNMKAVAVAITSDLEKLEPAHASDFDAYLRTFTGSLQKITAKIAEMSAKYAGTPVGLTETIFLYQSEPIGLKVLTPFDFEKAIAEGNDPPADAVIAAQNQLKNRQIRVLIYNEQTVDKVTTRLQNLAEAAGIPVVPVTETMPPSRHYQSWMLDQLTVLEQALAEAAK